MHQDLIERYIYAVIKTLPTRMREDVERELHSLISDMLEERCQDMPPTEHDVLVVLTELGRPAELAAKYRPERASYLIGPGYYAAYKFLLGLVLAAVAFGLAVASVITACAAAQPWYLALGQYLAQTFQALLGSLGAITLAFAILERKGVRMNLGEQDIAHLPPVPKKQERIPKAEPIAGIVFCTLFAFVFLAVPQVIGVYFEQGQWMPIFNVPKIQAAWPIIVAFTVLGVLRESVKLYEGRYTKRLAAVSAATNLLSAVLSCAFLLGSSILNPQFLLYMQGLFSGDAAFLGTVFGQINLIFLAVILFALCLDTVVTVYKAYKYGGREQRK